jgi:hypothetical protein
MSNFIRLIFGILALSTSAIVIAVGVGRTQPIPRQIAVLHLDECQPPCWLGILPGKTTFQEAWQSIVSKYDPERYLITEDYDSDRVIWVSIRSADYYLLIELYVSRYDEVIGVIVDEIWLHYILTGPRNSAPTTADLVTVLGYPQKVLEYNGFSGKYGVEYMYGSGVMFQFEAMQSRISLTARTEHIYFGPRLKYRFENAALW